MFYSVLKKLNFDGKLIVIDHNNKTYEFGNSTNKINLKVRLTNKSIEKKLFRNPALHFGEGYMNKEIIIEEGTIEELIDIVTLCYDDFVKNNFIFRVYENFSGYFKVFHQFKKTHFDYLRNKYYYFQQSNQNFSVKNNFHI